METVRPPITATAIETCSSAPSPNPRVSGNMARIVVKAVIRIGLNLTGPAVKIASSPAPALQLVNIINEHNALFTTIPVSIITPIKVTTLKDVLMKRARTTPIAATGWNYYQRVK